MRLFSVITAPFRAVGRALGGGGDDVSEPEREARPAAQPQLADVITSDRFERPTRLTVPPGESKVFEWKSPKPTFYVHWFPLKEQNGPGGDPTENLYANGGPLAKYDALFGTESQSVAWSSGRIPFYGRHRNETWAGHCNNASQVAALLDAPTLSEVTFTGRNNRPVTFTRRDLEGLLVVASENLMDGTEQVGSRNFGSVFGLFGGRSDLSPMEFLDTLREWSRYGRPFVLDTDPSREVWNYPYDQVLVTKNHDTDEYTFKLASTGFPKESLEMYAGPSGRFWSRGQIVWYANGQAQDRPDFMWRPIPRANPWRGPAELNSEVDMAQVKRIYDAFRPASAERPSLAA